MGTTLLLLVVSVFSWIGAAVEGFFLVDSRHSVQKNVVRRRSPSDHRLYVASFTTAPGDTVLSNSNERFNEGAIEQSTYRLLNATNVGAWDERFFREAETIIKAWSKRQSKRAALSVERLLGRIVKEQKAGNPYADCLDMTLLYTNLVEGWAKCDDAGAAERAEEILDYFQKVYEDGDSYDPLLCGPGLESFNAVIAAYARRGTDDAPQQAIRVLTKLYELIRDGRTTVMPNKETYARMFCVILWCFFALLCLVRVVSHFPR